MGECKNYFSIYELSDSSLENEMFFTSLCISNYVKLALFGSKVIFWLAAAIWSVFLIHTEYKITGKWSLNLKNKIYLICLASSIAGVISFSLMLGSVKSPVRYIFHALPQVIERVGIHLALRAWFKTVVSICYFGNKNVEFYIKQFNIFTYILELTIDIITLAIGIIATMIQYSAGNYYIVNWLYIMLIDANNIYGVIITVIIHVVGRKLAVICQQKQNIENGIPVNKDTVILGNRLAAISRSNKHSLLPLTLVCFIPLWMLTSRNPQTPLGLDGITFYYYAFNMVCLLGSVVMPWIISYQGGMFGISSSSSFPHPSSLQPSSSSTPNDNKNSKPIDTGSNVSSILPRSHDLGKRQLDHHYVNEVTMTTVNTVTTVDDDIDLNHRDSIV